jgi:exosortase A-associated hydrolase 2
LVAPAFGDEMNKTRRMITETAKRLNARGIAVVIPDLFGTGDSEGKFHQGGWLQWCDDLRVSDAWARGEDMNVVGLIGVRTGCLLAASFVEKSPPMLASVLWQPVMTGTSFVNQFLRLRIVSNSVNKGVRETSESLLQQLRSGVNVWVAGYELTDAIVGPLLVSSLDTLTSNGLGKLHVVNVKRVVNGSDERNEIVIGNAVASCTNVFGEPYWSAVETVCDERVVSETVLHLSECIARA